jgi:hypothetical protein
MKENNITVLMVAPGKHPKVTTLENSLDALQKAVSIGADEQGLIEIIGIDDRVCILCNEEGKLIGLEGNRRLGNDILTGVFYVIGEDGCGNLVSLPEAEIAKYAKLFWEPEVFCKEDVSSSIFVHFVDFW